MAKFPATITVLSQLPPGVDITSEEALSLMYDTARAAGLKEGKAIGYSQGYSAGMRVADTERKREYERGYSDGRWDAQHPEVHDYDA